MTLDDCWHVCPTFWQLFFPATQLAWAGQAEMCQNGLFWPIFEIFSKKIFLTETILNYKYFFPKINFFPIIALARAKWVWLAEMTSYLVISRWNFKIFFSPETYVELNKLFKKIFFPVNLLTRADWAEIGGSHIFD